MTAPVVTASPNRDVLSVFLPERVHRQEPERDQGVERPVGVVNAPRE